MTLPQPAVNRRELFSWAAHGLTGAALTSLLLRDGVAAPGEAADPPPHHPPRARRVIHLCLCGGMSHLDTFDHKPALARLGGELVAVPERR